MILKQYYLGCLAHASYLVGDEASCTAIIVDPQRDIQQYLADAEKFGLQIRHVFLTHFHADFVAGHLELRDRCGATIHLGCRAQAEYAFVAMKDGDTLDFPGLRLEVLETPGHTIESISILVFDLAKRLRKTSRGPYRRHSVHRRRGPPGPARFARVDSATISAHIFTTRFTTNYCAARRDAGLSRAWRRFALRKTAFLRHGLFAGRSTAFELRAAAHDEGGIYRVW